MVLVLNIMTQIANAVRFIHSHELVHRDLKPSNSCVPYPRRLILVLYSAETGFWRLADFGFTSRGTATRMQNTTWARGTEGYRAPELLRNKQFNNKVDIWSMGCILYELAANRRRFMFDYDVIVYYVNNTQLAVGLNGFFGEQDRVVLSKRFVRMTEREPDQRPSAATIYEEFRDLHEQKRSEELYTDTKTVEFPSDIVGEGRRVESLAEVSEPPGVYVAKIQRATSTKSRRTPVQETPGKVGRIFSGEKIVNAWQRVYNVVVKSRGSGQRGGGD